MASAGSCQPFADPPQQIPQAQMTLRQRIYAARRKAPMPRPKLKELDEAWQFVTQVTKHIFNKSRHKVESGPPKRRVLVDACSGNGLAGAIFLAQRRVDLVVFIDTAHVPNFDSAVRAGRWLEPFLPQATACVEKVTGDVAAELPLVLDRCVQAGDNVAVVSVHACGHLTDLVIDECMARGIDFGVMGCCHRDDMTHSQLKHVANEIGTSLGAVVDIVRMGRAVQSGYDVRFKTIDKDITPENRVLVGTPANKSVAQARGENREAARLRLVAAYEAAHRGAGCGDTH